VHLSLLANPSHLEAVDPIVLGKVTHLQQMPTLVPNGNAWLLKCRLLDLKSGHTRLG
jgi:hypothetical protein